MNWQDRISIDPAVLAGKPVIDGTRLAVELIIDLLAQGWTDEEIIHNYPRVTREDIQACLAYASSVLDATPITREYIHGLRGKYKGYGLINALMAARQREREQ